MFFTAPIWLTLLFPWAIFVAWLLQGQRKHVDVPFLDLWKSPLPKPSTRRALHLPPIALAAAIVALFLAILAAAGPALRIHDSRIRLTILIDRGLTMSARSRTVARFKELAQDIKPILLQQFGDGPVQLISFPAAQPITTTRANWSAVVLDLPPTAADTRADLQAKLADALSQSTGPILVLTDQSLSTTEPRVTRVSPDRGIANVAISQLAARMTPASQIMVRIRNQSKLETTSLRIFSDGAEIARKDIALPSDGQRDYFLDVPSLGKIISAELSASDDFPADNRAWLIQHQTWPILEPRTPLVPELQRLIESYTRLRAPSSGARRLAIVNAAESMPAEEPAIAVLIPTSQSSRPSGPPQVSQHPVIRDIDWTSVLYDADVVTDDLDLTWTSLVTVSGKAAVAVRSSPSRQAIVRFHSPTWPTTPQFVIFWTNLVDWVGEGGQVFSSQSTALLHPTWKPVDAPGFPDRCPPGLWPGLYRAADGSTIAVNAPDLPIPPPPTNNWRKDLTRLADELAPTTAFRPFASIVLTTSLLALLIAAASWRRRIVVRPL